MGEPRRVTGGGSDRAGLPHPDDIDNAAVGALATVTSAGNVSPDLIPGRTQPAPDYVITGPNPRPTGSVLGFALGTLWNTALKRMGVPTGSGETVHLPLENLAHSSYVPELEQPATIEEAWTIFKGRSERTITDTDAYANTQFDLLPAAVKPKFTETRDAVVALYQEEKDVMAAYMARVAEVGKPDIASWNQAQFDLDQAILANEFFKSRGVGPQEYAILKLHHDYNEYLAESDVDQKIASTKRARAFGAEMSYVLGVLTSSISKMMEAGLRKSQWLPLEDLAIEATKLYERLAQDTELNGRDYEKLQKIRAMVFPYSIPNWDASEIADIKAKDDAVESAKVKFSEDSKKYLVAVTPAALAVQRKAEEVSRKRESLDFEFQVARLEGELEKLKQTVAITTEDEAHFRGRIDAYKKAVEKYFKFWDRFATGNDVNAREHERNSLDKKSAFELLMQTQWDLYKLHEKYNTNARPSNISFSYATVAELMDWAFRNDRVKGTGIADFFHALFDIYPIIAEEVGFKGTPFKGRRALDLDKIDSMAGLFGMTTVGEMPRSYVMAGFKPLAYLLSYRFAHEAAFNIPGFKETYPEGFEDMDDLSALGFLVRANHIGIQEFKMNTGVGMLGFEAPQMAQGGAAVAPGIGDYLRQRAIVLDRKKGVSETNRQIVEFLLKLRSILIYPAGTRMVIPAGGHPYVDYTQAPNLVFMPRKVTDRLTTGQVSKINLDSSPRDIYPVVNIIHNGLELPEPTWFLGEGIGNIVAGNFETQTTLNFGPKPTTKLLQAVGLAMSSDAVLTAEQWKEVYPEYFVHTDGQPLSEREAYFMSLQLNEMVWTVDQRFTASAMDLLNIPEQNEVQKKQLAALAEKDPEQVRAESMQTMGRHLDARRSHLERAQAVYREENGETLSARDRALANSIFTARPVSMAIAQEKPEKKSPSLLSVSTKQKLAGVLSEDRALTLLGSTFPQYVYPSQPKGLLARVRGQKVDPKTMTAREFLIEAVQRGAEVAKFYQDKGFDANAVALDLDKIVWDHVYPVGGSELIRVLDGFLSERLGGPVSSANMREEINLNPLWLAFMIGYKEVYGKPPVIFSSTIAPRFQFLAAQIDKSPILKRFFELILDRDGLNAMGAQHLLGDYAVYREKLEAYKKQGATWASSARFDGRGAVRDRDVESYLKAQLAGEILPFSQMQDETSQIYRARYLDTLRLAFLTGASEVEPESFLRGAATNLLGQLGATQNSPDISNKLAGDMGAFVSVALGYLYPATHAIPPARHDIAQYDRIVTRSKIAAHIQSLMQKFVGNGYTTAGLTEAEATDIESILATNGDIHLKLRSLVPYQVLIDDREENAEEAFRHNDVTVFRQEPFTSDPARLYVTSDRKNDVRERLNWARTGDPIEIMRSLTDERFQGKHVVFSAKERAGRIPGLFDEPVSLQYPVSRALEAFERPKLDAKVAVSEVKSELRRRVILTRQVHRLARLELTEILKRNQDAMVAEGIDEVRFKNAYKMLDPNRRKNGKVIEVSGDADFEVIEWVVSRLPEGEDKTKALTQVERLHDRAVIDFYSGIETEKRRSKGGVVGNIEQGMRLAGKAAKYGSIFGSRAGNSLKHIVEDLVLNRIGYGGIVSSLVKNAGDTLALPGELLKLKALSDYLANPKDSKMAMADMLEAFGIVARILIDQYGDALLTLLSSDQRLKPENRDVINQNRASMDKGMDDMARGVQKLFAGLAQAYAGGEQMWGGASQVFGTEDDAHYRWWMHSGADLMAAAVGARYQIILNHRRENPTQLPEHVEASDVNTKTFYAMLDGLQTLVGSDNLFGQLLGEAKAHVGELGFANSLKLAFRMPGLVKDILNNKTAHAVVQGIKDGELDYSYDALAAYAASLRTSMSEKEKAIDKFEETARAAWILADPDMRSVVKEMVHAVYNQIFEGDQTFVPEGGYHRALPPAAAALTREERAEQAIKALGASGSTPWNGAPGVAGVLLAAGVAMAGNAQAAEVAPSLDSSDHVVQVDRGSEIAEPVQSKPVAKVHTVKVSPVVQENPLSVVAADSIMMDSAANLVVADEVNIPSIDEMVDVDAEVNVPDSSHQSGSKTSSSVVGFMGALSPLLYPIGSVMGATSVGSFVGAVR